MTTFKRRRIDVQFQLGTGPYGATGNNVVRLRNLRVTANISKAGGVSMSRAEVRIFGAPLDIMNQLTVQNQLTFQAARLNIMTILAGNDDDGWAVCFSGIISEAWADMRSVPDVVFHVVAADGYVDALKPVQPTSYKGTVDVATVIAGIAAQMSPRRSLENNGVNVQIPSTYLPGTLLDQLRRVARAADINCVLDSNDVRGNVIAIWPKGGSRGGGSLIISPDTGLIGYPAFTQTGVQFSTLYNPALTFGQKVDIRSSLTPANGEKVVANITHNLEAETVNGAWFTEVECGLFTQDQGPIPIVG